ncbi:MAG: ABC transporter permease, partial [Bacteroidota bacterium]
EIKHITRFKGGSVSLMAEERKVRQTGQYVDPDFLDMFSFPLIKGNRATALNDPKSIILTESLAKTLFGNDDPMGEIVRINNEYDAQVTGVISDIPENSFFSYITFLVPFKYNLANSYLQRYRDDWGSNVIWTFLEMNEGVSMDVFSDKISLINR